MFDNVDPDSITPEASAEEFQATVRDNKTIDLSWTNSDSAEDTDLEDDTEYYYRLFVYFSNPDPNPIYSSGVSDHDTTLLTLGEVTNMTATAIDEDEINLAWDSPMDSRVKGVLILRRTAASVNDQPQNGTTTYSVGDSIGNSEIIYLSNDTNPVLFEDTSGLSPSSLSYYKAFTYNQDFAMFSDGASTSATTLPPLPTVTNLEVTAKTYNSITLGWSIPNDDRINGIIVLRCEGNTIGPSIRPNDGTSYSSGQTIGSDVKVAAVTGEQSFLNTNLSGNTYYFYKVLTYSSDLIYSESYATTDATTEVEALNFKVQLQENRSPVWSFRTTMILLPLRILSLKSPLFLLLRLLLLLRYMKMMVATMILLPTPCIAIQRSIRSRGTTPQPDGA